VLRITGVAILGAVEVKRRSASRRGGRRELEEVIFGPAWILHDLYYRARTEIDSASAGSYNLNVAVNEGIIQ